MNPHSKSNRLLLVLALVLAGVVGLGVVWLRDRYAERQADTQAVARLKNIGLAFNTYDSKYSVLPTVADNLMPGATTTSGPKSKLSWRVAILEFVEESALYAKFHHDEPWDSPHNIQLLSEMPTIYLDPRMQSRSDREKGLTHWQVFMGEGTLLGGKEPNNLIEHQSFWTPPTFMVVEAREPVPWTKPEDIPYSVDKPFPQLGDPGRLTFLAVFKDCRVREIRHNASERSLRASVSHPHPGNNVPPPWE